MRELPPFLCGDGGLGVIQLIYRTTWKGIDMSEGEISQGRQTASWDEALKEATEELIDSYGQALLLLSSGNAEEVELKMQIKVDGYPAFQLQTKSHAAEK